MSDSRRVRDTGADGGADGYRSLPEEAYALALATTPSIGPARLRQILTSQRPSHAWAALHTTSGAADVAGAEVATRWRRHAELGVRVLLRDAPAFPSRLADDARAPALLFCLGDPSMLADRPTVALVGTRAPTRYGIGVAAQLGAELSAAGVSVVSGLALGIDGAAHEGACGAGAPPVGVVAGGLDEPYPRHHARLWERVAGEGVIVSEWPAGVRTERWRFPVRNKLLAALSDVVVVVESRHHGGSRHTVEAALERGVPVGAVPGSIRSPTSEGTNALLADGAFPVCSTSDILVALSLHGAGVATPPVTQVETGRGGDRRASLVGTERVVLEALSTDPSPLDGLARATGLALPELCGCLERLAQQGLARDVGGWWERG